ncbi:MAG: adenylate/guanylate cyclase domain-containing protein, partial [Myxococcota bacterium]|nr:adenylate/guanylate cyclase domain-containing protein [Myxococcota bacterium]
MPEAPTGIVTLVFTDIQGASALWNEATDPAEEAFRIHAKLFRDLLGEYRGTEIKNEADTFLLSFDEPLDAVRWCLAAQESLLTASWPEALLDQEHAREEHALDGTLLHRGLRVRMGVDRGRPESFVDPVTGQQDLRGPVVHRTQQVATAAHGGQVLLTTTIWTLVRGQLTASTTSLGPHRIREIEG